MEAGDTAQVLAVYSGASSCINVLERRCEAEWTETGVLNVQAWMVYEDDPESTGALFWRSNSCNAMGVYYSMDCGEVIVPDGSTFRVLLNGRDIHRAPIPLRSQMLEMR